MLLSSSLLPFEGMMLEATRREGCRSKQTDDAIAKRAALHQPMPGISWDSHRPTSFCRPLGTLSSIRRPRQDGAHIQLQLGSLRWSYGRLFASADAQ
jgi:hypothetical protein